jgi:hypothetical protein
VASGSSRSRQVSNSPWLLALTEQVYRGRHVLLHGNVNDLVLAGGRVTDLPEALVALLDGLGYVVVGRYDLVDGLCPAPGASSGAFDELLAQVTEESTPSSAELNSEGRPGRVADARDRLNRVARAPHSASAANPEVAAARIEQILRQPETATAVWVDAADLVIRDPRHIELSERQLLMRIKRAMREAASVSGARGHELRNVVIFTTPNLAHIPEGFVSNEPMLTSLYVSTPDVRERRFFLEANFDKYRDADQLDPEQREETLDRLARLTDGLGFRDLEAMARTSRLIRVGLRDPSRLVNYFRFGAQRDPWSDLSSSDVRGASSTLTQRVVGQPDAIEAVVEAVMAAHLGIDFVTDPNASSGRPKGAFFFVGPTGVGKTELAKALAQLLFEDETALIRFDMSEYGQEHSVERLIGSPPGYVGYGEGGQLTRQVIERPFSVLLFDEIEKAHNNVFDKFLQILDDGRLTDGQGRTADFSQTVIIFTSNEGTAELYADGDPTTLGYAQIREHYRGHITRFFRHSLGRPELLGRLGAENVLAFDVLRPEVLEVITRKFLSQLLASLRAAGIELELDDRELVAAVQRESQRSGALQEGGRGIRRCVDRILRRPVLRWLVENDREVSELQVRFSASTGETVVSAELPDTGAGRAEP